MLLENPQWPGLNWGAFVSVLDEQELAVLPPRLRGVKVADGVSWEEAACVRSGAEVRGRRSWRVGTRRASPVDEGYQLWARVHVAVVCDQVGD